MQGVGGGASEQLPGSCFGRVGWLCVLKILHVMCPGCMCALGVVDSTVGCHLWGSSDWADMSYWPSHQWTITLTCSGGLLRRTDSNLSVVTLCATAVFGGVQIRYLGSIQNVRSLRQHSYTWQSRFCYPTLPTPATPNGVPYGCQTAAALHEAIGKLSYLVIVPADG